MILTRDFIEQWLEENHVENVVVRNKIGVVSPGTAGLEIYIGHVYQYADQLKTVTFLGTMLDSSRLGLSFFCPTFLLTHDVIVFGFALYPKDTDSRQRLLNALQTYQPYINVYSE